MGFIAFHLVFEPSDRLSVSGLLTDEPVPSTNLTSPKLCDSSVTQHAGYLDVAIGTKYFFWMFESRTGLRAMLYLKESL